MRNLSTAVRLSLLGGAALATLLLLLLLLGDVVRYWIGEGPRWPRISPEAAGFDKDALVALQQSLARRGTVALLLVRRGNLVHEWYAPGRGPWRRQRTASLTKSLVGATALLLASNDGRIRIDAPVSEYIPTWRGDSLRSRITMRHLMNHSAGIPNAHGQGNVAWALSFWTGRPDLFQRVLREAPVISPPGTRFEYSGPGYAVVSYVLTACLSGSPTPDLESLLESRIMEPLGIPRQAWSLAPHGPFDVDGMRIFPAWSGASFTPPAAARIGEFMLHHGRWRGRQLLDSALVSEAVRHDGSPPIENPRSTAQPLPALGWWSNANGAWGAVPRDAFAGFGGGGQVLLVIPSLDLIVARFGTGFEDDGFYKELDRDLFAPLMRCVTDSRTPSLYGKGHHCLDAGEFNPLVFKKLASAKRRQGPGTPFAKLQRDAPRASCRSTQRGTTIVIGGAG